jgi:hypothetical protein
MRGAIPPLPQDAFMACCSVKAQEQQVAHSWRGAWLITGAALFFPLLRGISSFHILILSFRVRATYMISADQQQRTLYVRLRLANCTSHGGLVGSTPASYSGRPISNFSPKKGLWCFYSVSPVKILDITLKLVTPVSIHILRISSFIIIFSFDSR